jgi:hypothetical protein
VLRASCPSCEAESLQQSHCGPDWQGCAAAAGRNGLQRCAASCRLFTPATPPCARRRCAGDGGRAPGAGRDAAGPRHPPAADCRGVRNGVQGRAAGGAAVPTAQLSAFRQHTAHRAAGFVCWLRGVGPAAWVQTSAWHFAAREWAACLLAGPLVGSCWVQPALTAPLPRSAPAQHILHSVRIVHIAGHSEQPNPNRAPPARSGWTKSRPRLSTPPTTQRSW